MKRLNQIDLCRFVDCYTILLKPIPQTLWHIQQDGGLPEMLSKSFCGDIGTIHSIRLTTKKETNLINTSIRCHDETIASIAVEGLCTECLEKLMARSRVKIIGKAA